MLTNLGGKKTADTLNTWCNYVYLEKFHNIPILMGLLRHQIWKTSENKKTAKILPMLKSLSLVELRIKYNRRGEKESFLLLKYFGNSQKNSLGRLGGLVHVSCYWFLSGILLRVCLIGPWFCLNSSHKEQLLTRRGGTVGRPPAGSDTVSCSQDNEKRGKEKCNLYISF